MQTLQGMNERFSQIPVASAYQTSLPPQPTSSLDAAMAQLDATVANVQAAVAQITERLNPVLTPAGVERGGAQGDCSDTSQQPAPLVAGIEKQVFHLRQALAALHALDSRLAL